MKGSNAIQYTYKLLLALFGMFCLNMRGKVKMTEHVEMGIQSFPIALENMFPGGHIGKMLVDLSGGIAKEI